MNASIVLCTRNMAASLTKTLAGLSKVEIPSGVDVELVLVDNASTDDTPNVIQNCRIDNMSVVRASQPVPGRTLAMNQGAKISTGDILLYTDDDVVHPASWVSEMCAPILGGSASIVAGGVLLAPHLKRPWMGPEHETMLASTQCLDPSELNNVIGANFAVDRKVFGKGIAFDPELGPGALGFQDEVTFSRQAMLAGFALAKRLDCTVEHHFKPDRLSRASFLRRARMEGHSLAYVAHHWEHRDPPVSWKQFVRTLLYPVATAGAWPKRVLNGVPASSREMRLMQGLGYYEQFLVERRRARNYDKFGLTKIAGTLP